MASNHIESNTLQFSEDMEKPHILVIATGGTIASKEGDLFFLHRSALVAVHKQ